MVRLYVRVNERGRRYDMKLGLARNECRLGTRQEEKK